MCICVNKKLSLKFVCSGQSCMILVCTTVLKCNSSRNLIYLLQAIQDIADQWKDLTLDVAAYKDRGHFRLK